MIRGYIKLFRCVTENEMWLDEPFSRGQAWIDLLILANHKPGVVRKRGIRIDVERGQVGLSETSLAERWQWSRGKVHRFLSELEKDAQIEQQNVLQNLNVTSLITILNYDKYQDNEPQNEPQTDRKRTANSTMNKKVKNEKNKTLKPEGDKMLEICLAWKAFVEMRQVIKKPMTEYAMKLKVMALEKLQEQGHDPVAVLNQSVSNNWQDVYAIKAEKIAEASPLISQATALDPARAAKKEAGRRQGARYDN